ncbi:MAG: cob(I)yrinic acid a,c-diamide adenosyltransferase [Arachnia sp.]
MTKGRTPTEPDDGLSTKERRNRPLVLVNTGDGKGKTSAAMGMAMRAWAQGWSVGVYQFVKSASWKTGEYVALTRLGELEGDLTFERMGTGCTWMRSAHGGEVTPEEAAQAAWAHVRQGIAEERHRFWLLDEFTYPMAWGWVDVDEVTEALASRPGTQHVVITGRRCPQPILDLADLVTEMTKIKHPFDKGQKGQAGIEW